MKINMSYEQFDLKYSILMSALGASVSKHLIDKHYTCLWANDYYYELIGYPKPVYETMFHSHCDEYFCNNSQGWTKLVEYVDSALEQGENGYSLYLPLIYPTGEILWVKLKAIFTDEFIDGYRVSYIIMIDVTDMMQEKLIQEDAWQHSEKMLQEQGMIISALNISVSKHLIDEHYTCVEANEYFYKLTGYSKKKYKELFHDRLDEFYANNPEGWELLTGKVISVLENNEDRYDAIIPMKYEDGSSYWVKQAGFFTDEYIDGFRICYTFMTNVTELVRTKNELEMLISSMEVSISKHLMDEHSTVVWANEFYYQLIGYCKEDYEMLFHNHCDEYFQDNETGLKLFNEKIQSMTSTTERSCGEFLPLRLQDSSIVWVKMVGFLTDEYIDGKQIAYVTMIDVTDLMQTQMEKSIAYDNIPGFIIRHRILPDRIVMIDASEKTKDIFAPCLEDTASADPFSVLSAESRQFIAQHFSELRKGEPLEATICAIDKYGHNRWFHINSNCIDMISEDPVFLTVFIDITDITELRELQHKLKERTELLNNALEEAKYANAAKSNFLSNMSHDIRTPLNAITGMTEIANIHIDNQDRVKDCLQKIRRSSHHLSGLINDVLDMAKIENGNFSINIMPMCLPEEIREVIMIVLPGIRAKHQKFDVYIKELSCENFSSDALRVRQILLNLLSNSSKFTPEDGRIVFEVEMQEIDNKGTVMLCFTISDNGIGMTPKYLDQIFEPFTREKDSRTDQIEGSGLGMTITKRLTDLLGGRITVESQPGVGTVFKVFVPLNILPDSAKEYRDYDELSLLLIDDDPMQQKYAGNMLRSMGIEVECTSFDAAEEQFWTRQKENEKYNLIILSLSTIENESLERVGDMCMKLQDGVPLFLAVYDVGEIKEKALELGICGFVDRPFSRFSITRCMDQYLFGKDFLRQKKELFDFSGIRILLVEDNELNREIALELLSRFGLKVETAVNGKEAVQHFEESCPGYYSLILMDIQMPVMNGYEATRTIRSLFRDDAKTVPILAMTADAFIEDIENAKAMGMNGHLAKPLDFELIAREISKYLCK